MNELQIVCIPLTIYLISVIGTYIHVRWTKTKEVQKGIPVKNVNAWIKRLRK